MNRIDGQPAYVLHARPYRETSLLLECFTRDHGRVGLVARGVRRERSRLPRGVLQPLQALLLAWSGQGELATLVGAEPADTPLRLDGERLYAGIYLNELVLRLSGRGDPHPQAWAAYALCLRRLAEDEPIAWTLRRFERDLLADLGYALVLSHDAVRGEALDPQHDYVYDVETGAHPADAAGHAPRIRGSALLALAQDRMPSAADLASLRRLMRGVIRHHLGGGSLQAWTVWAGPGAS